jgi:hypothetical protein
MTRWPASHHIRILSNEANPYIRLFETKEQIMFKRLTLSGLVVVIVVMAMVISLSASSIEAQDATPAPTATPVRMGSP